MQQDPLFGDHLQPLLTDFVIILLVLHHWVEVATPSLNEVMPEGRDNRCQALSKEFISVLNQGGFWCGVKEREREGERERERERERMCVINRLKLKVVNILKLTIAERHRDPNTSA